MLSRFVDHASDFLGGMWAVVAVVFVFRDQPLQVITSAHDVLAQTLAGEEQREELLRAEMRRRS